jgi:serine/threonine-protein kinase RsbW
MQTVTFPGQYDNLAKISEFVTGAARAAGLDSAGIYAVELAVDEACANIIDHAYGGEGIGEIECSVEILENGLKIILRDQGKSFDPEQVNPPKLGVPLEDLKPRGVGLYLMKKMVDEVHYQAGLEGHNVLMLVKRKK